MSDEFDPDAFLAKKDEAFDPDAFLAKPEPPPAPTPEPEPSALSPKSMTGTVMRHFGQGVAYGFGDELRGVSGALQEIGSRGPLGRAAAFLAPAAAGPLALPAAIASSAAAPELLTGKSSELGEFGGESLLDALVARYRKDRDLQRSELQAGAEANPKTAIASSVAGALAAPGSGGSTALGRIGSAAAGGALYGAGSSGDVGPGNLPKDIATGAGLGLLGGAVGEGVGMAGSRIVNGMASRIGDEVATRAAKDAQAVADEVASLKGAYGAETQKASRQLENVQRGVNGVGPSYSPGGIDPALQSRAIQAIHSPEAAALQTGVLENTLDALPGQLASVDKAKQAFQSASANAPKEAATRTQRYFNAPILSADVIPRFDRLKARAMTGLAGAAVGAPAGALYGLATGESPGKRAAEFSALLGAGGLLQPTGLLTMARNVAASPRVRAAALEGGIGGIQAASTVAGRAGTGAEAATQTVRGLKPEDQEAVDAFLDAP